MMTGDRGMDEAILPMAEDAPDLVRSYRTQTEVRLAHQHPEDFVRTALAFTRASWSMLPSAVNDEGTLSMIVGQTQGFTTRMSCLDGVGPKGKNAELLVGRLAVLRGFGEVLLETAAGRDTGCSDFTPDAILSFETAAFLLRKKPGLFGRGSREQGERLRSEAVRTALLYSKDVQLPHIIDDKPANDSSTVFEGSS
ncbi:hypothetical protein M1555_02060 [Patescibacteria group bacterium]|nr:hypothetical protein [Patescibacteria group bacterium]